MILHSLSITCSPNDTPNDRKIFSWKDGDDVFSIECAIAKLQEYVDQRKDTLKTALAFQPPIETPL